jgi:hypothetical protein
MFDGCQPAHLCCLRFSVAAYAGTISLRLQQHQLLLCCINLSTRLHTQMQRNVINNCSATCIGCALPKMSQHTLAV